LSQDVSQSLLIHHFFVKPCTYGMSNSKDNYLSKYTQFTAFITNR